MIIFHNLWAICLWRNYVFNNTIHWKKKKRCFCSSMIIDPSCNYDGGDCCIFWPNYLHQYLNLYVCPSFRWQRRCQDTSPLLSYIVLIATRSNSYRVSHKEWPPNCSKVRVFFAFSGIFLDKAEPNRTLISTDLGEN